MWQIVKQNVIGACIGVTVGLACVKAGLPFWMFVIVVLASGIGYDVIVRKLAEQKAPPSTFSNQPKKPEDEYVELISDGHPERLTDLDREILVGMFHAMSPEQWEAVKARSGKH